MNFLRAICAADRRAYESPGINISPPECIADNGCLMRSQLNVLYKIHSSSHRSVQLCSWRAGLPYGYTRASEWHSLCLELHPVPSGDYSTLSNSAAPPLRCQVLRVFGSRPRDRGGSRLKIHKSAMRCSPT